MEEKAVHQFTASVFGTIASGFVIDSLQAMFPWLITMFSVIICDLAMGVRKSLLMNEKVRISRAIRATMGKMVTYFSFVVMVVFINKSAGGTMGIDVAGCLLVCGIEGISIIGNILKPKGYDIDLGRAITLVFNRTLHVAKEDMEEVVKKNEDEDFKRRNKGG